MIYTAVKRLASIWLVVSVVWCGLVACAEPSKLPIVSVKFASPQGSASGDYSLEVCSTDSERALGLMYRRSLAEHSGMLFVFPHERENSFWMKNTYIPLDMIFVDADLKVVGILEDVPPLNEVPRSVGKPSKFVVELGAGVTRKHGVVVGSRMVVDGDIPQAR